MKDLTNSQLIQRLLACHTLVLLHKEQGGLEQHRKHNEEQMEICRSELLSRLTKVSLEELAKQRMASE